MKTLKIKLTGTRKLIMHNSRLANPLDPWSIKKKQIKTGKNMTDEDRVNLMMVEARGGIYETADGFVGIPSCAVYASFIGGAKNFKLGKELKKSMRHDDVVQPILLNGEKVSVKDYLGHAENIDYRSVGQQKSRIMRARPVVKEGWVSIHEFELDEKVMDERTLKPILDYAGDYVGILEMRPTIGTYKAEVVK